MPLLYGEGKKSFIRLQEEIMKSSYDHTLFAWSQSPPTWTAENFVDMEALTSTSERQRLCGLLAESPELFIHVNDIMPLEDNFQSDNDVTVGSGRIVIQLPVFQKRARWFAALPCIVGRNYLAIPFETWHADFVARREEVVLVQADDLYDSSGALRMQRLQIKPPIQMPVHAQSPAPAVSYAIMIPIGSLHPVQHIREVHWSPHTSFDKETGKLTLTCGHMGLHAACLFQVKEMLLSPSEVKFREAVVLVGGDFTGDCKPWVGIVPILPDTYKDKLSHKLSTFGRALTTQRNTRSIWIDQHASRSGQSCFSEAGRQQVTDWLLDEASWVQKPHGGHETVHVSRTDTVTAMVDVVYVRPAKKVFKVSLKYQ